MASPLRTSVALALAWRVVLATEDCTLQCNPDLKKNATCKFTTPEDLERYAEHPMSVDGKALTWHDIKSQNGMHCDCPYQWTGLTCETPFALCDGDHVCYNGGSCVPGLVAQFGNDQLFCNCEKAVDKDGNRYVGKYCEQTASAYCDFEAGLLFCLNDGTCNKDFP
jgi:hypothetical protein